jgi:hypothetical protein
MYLNTLGSLYVELNIKSIIIKLIIIMIIKKCRSCLSVDLESSLNLGNQALTGVFPKSKKENISKGNLSLVFCKKCSLLQLSENFSKIEMYGMNYGYMSSLNPSMVSHLRFKANKLQNFSKLENNDCVLDIGSNDGTFLGFFSKKLLRVGVDPTIKKFYTNYKNGIIGIPEFFSKDILYKYKIFNKPKLITSISMFYDLDDPLSFAKDIYESLDDDGLWHLEQSYLPTMIKNLSYDTICHEHLEYYSLKSIKYILDKADFKIIDIELNNVNGGSFSLIVAKKKSKKFEKSRFINWLLKKEDLFNFNKIQTVNNFATNVKKHKELFRDLVLNLKDMKKIVFGYGASTKGNVILQYCNLNSKHLSYMVDVNPYKRNRYTPGSRIKIISEKDFKSKKADYLIVFPWHFRDFIIDKEKFFLKRGGHLIFPLPEIEII